MRRVAFLVISAGVLPVAGCYESFSLPSELSPDGAVRDAGVVAPPDAGRDGARPNDSGPRDAGVSPCATGETIPPYAGPGCATSTRACIEACNLDPSAPPDCVDLCFADDFECAECVNHTLITCANELGCQAAWNAFACCTETECPGVGSGLGRLDCAAAGLCLPEVDAYGACIEMRDLTTCDTRIQNCF